MIHIDRYNLFSLPRHDSGKCGWYPQAGRNTAGGQRIWPPPWGAGAHTGWILALFFIIILLLLLLFCRRGTATKVS